MQSASAAAMAFVCTHVRQALQHVAAMGACSPYLAAARETRPCHTVFTVAAYANRQAERGTAAAHFGHARTWVGHGPRRTRGVRRGGAVGYSSRARVGRWRWAAGPAGPPGEAVSGGPMRRRVAVSRQGKGDLAPPKRPSLARPGSRCAGTSNRRPPPSKRSTRRPRRSSNDTTDLRSDEHRE
jgi:hypothetical protein